jgi:hypothetical protein
MGREKNQYLDEYDEATSKGLHGPKMCIRIRNQDPRKSMSRRSRPSLLEAEGVFRIRGGRHFALQTSAI